MKSNEETPAITALRGELRKLAEAKIWHENNRDHAREMLENANVQLVELAGEQDSVEAALKTLVGEQEMAALLARRIAQQEAVDRLGGVL